MNSPWRPRRHFERPRAASMKTNLSLYRMEHLRAGLIRPQCVLPTVVHVAVVQADFAINGLC